MRVLLRSQVPLSKIMAGTVAGIIIAIGMGVIEEYWSVNIPVGVASLLAVLTSFWVSYSVPLYHEELIVQNCDSLEEKAPELILEESHTEENRIGEGWAA